MKCTVYWLRDSDAGHLLEPVEIHDEDTYQSQLDELVFHHDANNAVVVARDPLQVVSGSSRYAVKKQLSRSCTH